MPPSLTRYVNALDTLSMQVTNYVFTVLFSGVLPIIRTAPTIDEGVLRVSADTGSVVEMQC
jgi:hypothetical protein